jgi:hypothetical protein
VHACVPNVLTMVDYIHVTMIVFFAVCELFGDCKPLFGFQQSNGG